MPVVVVSSNRDDRDSGSDPIEEAGQARIGRSVVGDFQDPDARARQLRRDGSLHVGGDIAGQEQRHVPIGHVEDDGVVIWS